MSKLSTPKLKKTNKRKVLKLLQLSILQKEKSSKIKIKKSIRYFLQYTPLTADSIPEDSLNQRLSRFVAFYNTVCILKNFNSFY